MAARVFSNSVYVYVLMNSLSSVGVAVGSAEKSGLSLDVMAGATYSENVTAAPGAVGTEAGLPVAVYAETAGP